MKEFKGTPGEWSWYVTDQWPETNHFYGISCEGGTGQVAKIEGKGEEAEANARLMASSKKLLSAGREALALLEGMGAGVNDKGYADLTAAIAAATGATP